MEPKLRFKEFSGDWEEKSIEFLGTVVTGNTPSTNDSTNYGDEYMFVSPGDLGASKYISKTEKMLSKKGFNSCRKLEKGSILVTCIGSTIGKIGIANHRMTTNQQINSIIVNNIYNNEFIYYSLIFNFPKYMNFIGKQAVPILNKSQFEKLKLKCPSFIEQKKIANFLSTVDDKIQNQQDKISHLENIKKGFMQKIFFRKIRFKDDGGDEFPEWEKKKLKEIGNISTGTTPPTKNNEYFGGRYLWVTPSDINQNKDIKNTERKLSEKGLQKGKIIEANSIMVTCIASIGKNCILREKGSCNQQINAITPLKKYNVDFIYYAMSTIKNKMIQLAGQTATPILNKVTFENIDLKVPCLEEQRKIADFLSAFDEKIDAERETLNHLKEIKRGLLQQIFV